MARCGLPAGRLARQRGRGCSRSGSWGCRSTGRGWAPPSFARRSGGGTCWPRRSSRSGGSSMRLGALADEPRVSELLASVGYREVPRSWRMSIAFDGPPQPPAALPGIELRPFATGDERAAAVAMAEAFADHCGPEAGGRVGCTPTSRRRRRSIRPVDAGMGRRVAGRRPDRRGTLDGTRPSAASPSWACGGVPGPGHRRGDAARCLRQAPRPRDGRVHLYVDSESQTGATRLYERVGMASPAALRDLGEGAAPGPLNIAWVTSQAAPGCGLFKPDRCYNRAVVFRRSEESDLCSS